MTSVFLTGATGFVGSATLHRLLEDDRVEQVSVLVRARDLEHARVRVAAALARYRDTTHLDRVVPIVGSLTDFSLPRSLRDRVTHVVHAAAHTSFLSVRTARASNVDGTRAMVQAFAGAPRLRRFLYVGTAYRLGVADVREVDEAMPSSADHVVEYTRTKAEAETLLGEVPAVIARPSIVIGHSTLGVRPSASLFWYYRALAAAGVSAFPDHHRRDVVPTDWCADAMVRLLLAPALHHATYHLSAGAERSCTWAQIRERFAELGHAARTHEYVAADALGAHRRWAELGLSETTVRAVAAVARFSLLPYDVFSNRRLLAEGIAPPTPFTELIPLHLRSCARSIDEQAGDDV